MNKPIALPLSFLFFLSLATLAQDRGNAPLLAANQAAEAGAPPDRDAELNAVYKKLLADHKGDQAFKTALRETQRAWLQYRDARANLEAVISGDAARGESTVRLLTSERLEELKHVGIDGLPSDLATVPADNGSLLDQARKGYKQFRQEIVDRKSPGLLLPWVLSQKAWNEYSSKENDFDITPKARARGSFVFTRGLPDPGLSLKVLNRLEAIHWADLKTLAGEAGLKPVEPYDASANFWGNPFDMDTLISPDKHFLVESSSQGPSEQSEESAVVSCSDYSRQALADPAAMANGSVGDKTVVYSSQVDISPDSRWIFQVALRSKNSDYRGNAYLYEVTGTTPVMLRRAFKDKSFAQAALRSLDDALHGKYSLDSIELASWKPDKVLFDIGVYAASNPDTVRNWQCAFDLKNATFSKPVKLKDK